MIVLPDSTLKSIPPALNARLSRHFAAGAVVALAAVVASATSATAAIIYVGTGLNIPSTTAGVYLNVVTGVSGPTPASVPGWDLNAWSATNLLFYANNAASPNDGIVVGLGSSLTQADNLPTGSLIDGTYVYGRTPSSETTGATAFTLNSSNNLVGFRFLNETTTTINYGWMRLAVGVTLGAQPRSIMEYAYENSGAGIQAGVVPEPATWSLLGAVALIGRRRRH